MKNQILLKMPRLLYWQSLFYSLKIFKHVWQKTTLADSLECRNGHFSNEQYRKDLCARAFFQKIALES